MPCPERLGSPFREDILSDRVNFPATVYTDIPSQKMTISSDRASFSDDPQPEEDAIPRSSQIGCGEDHELKSNLAPVAPSSSPVALESPCPKSRYPFPSVNRLKRARTTFNEPITSEVCGSPQNLFAKNDSNQGAGKELFDWLNLDRMLLDSHQRKRRNVDR